MEADNIAQVDAALTTILTIKVHLVDALLDTMTIALQDHLVTEEVAIAHQVKTHLVTMVLEMMVSDVAVTSLEAVLHAVKAFHQVVVSGALLVLLRTLEATTTHQEQQVSEVIHLQEDNIKDDNISKVFAKRHPRFGFFLPKKSNEL